MGFRNDTQRGEVCALLTSWIRGAPFWVPDTVGIPRPTQLAIDIAKDGAGRSRTEVAMVRIALLLWGGSIWGDDEGEMMQALFYSFDRKRQRAIATLLLALTEDSRAIDTWLRDTRW